MSEQNTETQNDSQEQEFNEVEQRAVEMGWRPKDEWEGDPAKWRSAELFVELQPFYEKIESLSKQNKNHKKQMEQVAKDMMVIKDQAYQKALAELRSERQTALEEGDFARATVLEDKMDLVKEERQQTKQAMTQAVEDKQEEAVAFVEWKTRNTWYNRDEDLKDWADARGIRLHQSGMSPDEVLGQLEKEVRTRFPEKFTNPNRNKPGAVESGNRGSARAEKVSMTPEEKRIMDTIIRSTGMSEADYLKEYKSVL